MAERKIELILVAYEFLEPKHLEAIRAAAPGADVERVSGREWEERRADLGPRVEVAIGMLPLADLRGLPKLRWLQQTGAGADWLLHAPEIAASDLILTNASGVHAIPIAEHILALMFVLSRRMHRFVKAQLSHEWFRRGRLGELEGSTLGIVGLGAIGAKTAEKARGLGMRVLGLRRNPAKSCPYVERTYGPQGLGELLAQSDWVAVAAALTPETRHLIGDPELRQMKPSAYLINIARGSVIDQDALVEALTHGRLAGAGLDVFADEPNVPAALIPLDNVVLLPHVGSGTVETRAAMEALVLANLDKFLQSGELVTPVR